MARTTNTSLLKALRDWPDDKDMSRTRRLADLLNWAAQARPYEVIPYNYMAKLINGGKLPSFKSVDVQRIRGTLSSGTKRYLREVYGRELVSVRSVGARATVDSLDVAESTTPLAQRRLLAASRSMEANLGLIVDSEIPAEKKHVKSHLRGLRRDVLKVIREPSFQNRLLPPADDDDTNTP